MHYCVQDNIQESKDVHLVVNPCTISTLVGISYLIQLENETIHDSNRDYSSHAVYSGWSENCVIVYMELHRFISLVKK